MAVFWAVAAAVSWLPNRSAAVRLLCLLVVFAVIEWTRGFVASGFPWSLMGGIFAVHLSSLQMASIIGVYGLTFLAFGCVVAPLLWILSARRLALILLMLPVVGTFWGNVRLDSQPVAQAATAPVIRLVQPAVPQQDKWNRQKRPAHLATLIDLSQAGKNKPDFLIWPETAFAGLPSQNRLLLADTVRAATHPGGFLLTGIPRFNGDNRPLNSAFLFDHQAGLRGVYDKRHLVPFGEYVPFRSWVPFLDIIAGPADFVAGEHNHLMAVPGIGQVQTLICYEVIFAGQVITQTNRPDVIVNITNDAWFGKTIGPSQHLASQIFRSVEKAVFFLRSANSGISVVVSGKGEILKEIKLNSTGYIDIQTSLSSEETFFEKHGNTSVFLIILFLGLLFYLIEFLISLKRYK